MLLSFYVIFFSSCSWASFVSVLSEHQGEGAGENSRTVQWTGQQNP